ncbi:MULTISPECIES: hypothetical protein [Cronobacter]|uniref:hypothetical protein n=1 Tax=Cronobacter TaxID=413496 RepID=UPI001554562C|nr:MULTISPECIES: hypothetical protein [Cronobacter]ELY4156478.1 hypothetical protein [Cronobacter turicensis]ELY2495264.1 hypothetical protein [Cronobacter muytjensii]ELY4385905.1 hypothetical protein [Cronobacter turicensis]ELY6269901.1 hypothetical protein [Cronobacter turicensis]NUW60852.1 hypothetical protein [Cronobacter muytjensii]
MSDFGYASWDENGNPNNYGIKPVSVIGHIRLTNGQKSGTYSFNVPAGYKLGFIVVPAGASSYIEGRRVITISGNAIVIGGGTNNSLNQHQAGEAHLVVFVEVA